MKGGPLSGPSLGPERIRALGPGDVRKILARSVLVDGYDLVLDLKHSRGADLVDAVTGDHYLDFYSSFASAPLGLSPPQLLDDDEFMRHLALVAVNKPSNPDLYTVEYARFVATFARVLGDEALPRLFFIDGGALAVESALKTAFDWKWQRMSSADGRSTLRVLHLEGAFHGRSGYTLSLTNTEPVKTDRFPKFDWPRIPAPALRFPLAANREANQLTESEALFSAQAAFSKYHDIACFIAEPIQSEGGDNHLSSAFLGEMQDLCHRYDALFVLDEVQTGGGSTGTPWLYQQLGLEPDLVAFGKKTQVCGIMAGRRIDDVPDNALNVSARLGSTWGGSLTDMVRVTRLLEVIEQEGLFAAAARQGAYLLAGLEQLAARYPVLASGARGRGLMCAIDLRDAATRDAVVRMMREAEHVLVLHCGERTLRLRPPLTITEAQIDAMLAAMERCLKAQAP